MVFFNLHPLLLNVKQCSFDTELLRQTMLLSFRVSDLENRVDVYNWSFDRSLSTSRTRHSRHLTVERQESLVTSFTNGFRLSCYRVLDLTCLNYSWPTPFGDFLVLSPDKEPVVRFIFPDDLNVTVLLVPSC